MLNAIKKITVFFFFLKVTKHDVVVEDLGDGEEVCVRFKGEKKK